MYSSLLVYLQINQILNSLKIKGFTLIFYAFRMTVLVYNINFCNNYSKNPKVFIKNADIRHVGSVTKGLICSFHSKIGLKTRSAHKYLPTSSVQHNSNYVAQRK